MACKHGKPEEAEDFSQEAAIAFWEAEKSGAFFNLKYKFIDYLRDKFGDTRAKYMHNGVSLNCYKKENIDDYSNLLSVNDSEKENPKLKYYLYLKANPYELSIALMYLKGLEMKKIGRILNISESRISKILKNIRK